jgi:hypothetical protein
MKLLFVFAILLISETVLATSKIAKSGQNSEAYCEISGTYEGLDAKRLKKSVDGDIRTSDLIFWNVDISDVSDKTVCPELGKQTIRVRSATFSGTEADPKVTYGVNIRPPRIKDRIKLKVRFIKGTDVYVSRDYQEWTFVEILEN